MQTILLYLLIMGLVVLAVFAVVWFLTLFVVLPIGLRTQDAPLWGIVIVLTLAGMAIAASFLTV